MPPAVGSGDHTGVSAASGRLCPMDGNDAGSAVRTGVYHSLSDGAISGDPRSAAQKQGPQECNGQQSGRRLSSLGAWLVAEGACADTPALRLRSMGEQIGPPKRCPQPSSPGSS